MRTVNGGDFGRSGGPFPCPCLFLGWGGAGIARSGFALCDHDSPGQGQAARLTKDMLLISLEIVKSWGS